MLWFTEFGCFDHIYGTPQSATAKLKCTYHWCGPTEVNRMWRIKYCFNFVFRVPKRIQRVPRVLHVFNKFHLNTFYCYTYTYMKEKNMGKQRKNNNNYTKVPRSQRRDIIQTKHTKNKIYVVESDFVCVWNWANRTPSVSHCQLMSNSSECCRSESKQINQVPPKTSSNNNNNTRTTYAVIAR